MAAKPNIFRLARNKLVAGLLIVIPLVITFQSLWWLFHFVDDFANPLVLAVLDREIPGIGFMLTLVLLFIIGLLFSAGPLRSLLDGLEEVLEHIPLVGVVYTTIKKVFEGFGDLRSKNAFKRFVFARLPGRTTPGFLTGSFDFNHPDGSVDRLLMIYIPTNHLWFGDMVVLPAEDVIETNVSVEDGISLILSAGAAVPSAIEDLGRPE